MDLTFHPLDEASARAVANWRYSPPYEVYNEDPARIEEVVQTLLDPTYHYYRIARPQDPLVAYCCFGRDAQVPGGNYDLAALDIGLMVRPDLTGQGQGGFYVHSVLDFAQSSYPASVYRVTIAEFNRRAQRVWEKAGFQRAQAFRRQPDGLPFVILIRHEQPLTTAQPA